MLDLVICEKCGNTFSTSSDVEICPTCQSAHKPPRQQVSAETKSTRKQAKFFGAKALRGTKKQKEWAEKIRSEKMRQFDDASVLAFNGPWNHSKFWIENRNSHGATIEESINEMLAGAVKIAALQDEIQAILEEAMAQPGGILSDEQSAQIKAIEAQIAELS